MSDENKIGDTQNTPKKVEQSDVERWIFSLTPIGIAFVFYIMFILSSDIENKELFIAYGAAAGLIGLEAYWIMRGVKSGHVSTIIMGILGILITLGLLMLYI